MAKAADPVVKIHDLLVDGVGATSEQEPARHRLFCVDANECGGVLTGRSDGLRSVCRLRAIPARPAGLDRRLWGSAIDLWRELRRHTTRQKLCVLGCRPETGVDEPQELTTNPDTLLVRVADIDKGRIGEVVGADCGQAGLLPRLAIRCPGPPRLRFTAQDQDVDHTAPANLAC